MKRGLKPKQQKVNDSTQISKLESRCEILACKDLKMSYFRSCCLLALVRLGHVCCGNNGANLLKVGLFSNVVVFKEDLAWTD